MSDFAQEDRYRPVLRGSCKNKSLE
ncbi:MAG: hypothetical protein JWR24_4369, partial [Actinoallomurus sp.]|nr:hypothetical protein [Actinoallomurus sp.]